MNKMKVLAVHTGEKMFNGVTEAVASCFYIFFASN
jgi:hypothetical protein